MSTCENNLWLNNPMDAFLKWKAAQRVHGRALAPHTVEQYAAMFGVYLEWLAHKQQSFLTIQADGIESFLNGLTPRRPRVKHPSPDVSPSTRRRYLGLLHGVYAHLHQQGIKTNNPCEHLIELAQQQANQRPTPALLRPAAAKRFIEWTNQQPIHSWLNVRDSALRLIFLASGISVSEARSLTIDDVIWDEDSREPVSLNIAPHGFVKARVVPIRELGRAALANWLSAHQALQRDMHTPDATVLFLARVNDPNRILPAPIAISAPELFNIIQEATMAAGHRGTRQGAQTLRNTFVAQMLAEGHDETTLARWLGLTSTEQVFAIGRLVPHRKNITAAT